MRNISAWYCGILRSGSSRSLNQVTIGHNILITKCNILKEQILIILSLSQKESNNLIQCKKMLEQQKKKQELLPHASEHLHIPVSVPNFLQSKRAKLVCVTKNPKNMLLCRYLLSNKSICNFNATQRISLKAVVGSPLLSFIKIIVQNFIQFAA